MTQTMITGLLWFSAIGCGLLAGLYFAFSAFIMRALGRVDHAAGMAAMNAVNVEILRSLFMPLFFGTTIASATLAAISLVHWAGSGGVAMLAGGVTYVAGMFAVTVFFNVPLNNALAAADPASSEAPSLWARYRHDWTRWNHVRTASSTLACGCFIAAIAAR